MSKVPAELVDLLQALFDQGELSRALEREDWSVELVKHLRPAEHETPDAWFHGVVRLAAQRDEVTELLAVVRRLRPKRATEIDAAGRLFAAHAKNVAPVAEKHPAPPKSRPAPQQRRPVRVLHLTDLHFSAKVSWDQMPVLTSLVSEVSDLRAELGPIHRVVITGDIANFGTAEEYAEAAKWLKGPLAAASGVNASQIRMVPGNHDVDRLKVNLAVNGLDAKVLSKGGGDTITLLMRDRAKRKLLLARQAAYRNFAKGFNPQDDAPGWRSNEEIEGWAVHFIGLNTALLSGSHQDARGEVDDHHHLAIGGWQWSTLFPADRPVADLTVALMHHPWEALAERDSRAHREAAYDRCGVILRGHLHTVDTLSARRDGRLVLEAAAGACYADPRDGWPHGFQLLELDPGIGLARVYLRKWHSRTRRWLPDRERYPNTGADGLIELELRRSPKAPTPRAMTPAELALSELFSDEFTTPALNAWLSADPRLAPARSALDQAGEGQNDRFDLLAVTLTQLGLVDEVLFVSLIHERPQSAQAVSQVARACGVTLSVKVQALALEAPPADALTRYSRLDLVVTLEELQIRRDRARRSKHDLDDLNEQINAVARRLASAPPPRVGAVVAGATLEARIASGAFGTVWRGRAPDGQTVAVKMFHPEQLTTNMAVWGFRRGIRTMRLFERRGGPASLVRVLSVSEDELAFTMPFIDGATLEATDLRGWTLTQRLDCFQAICEAIQFAHDVQVIHRDLKPANIMVDRSGAPVVIDFDAADVGHATLLSMAINVGTLGYLAPEQNGEARASVLMDVYSLGRVLHFLLLGGHSKLTIAYEPTVRSELSAAPPALIALVLRACNLSPEARPASVRELLRELGVARAAPTAVEPDGPQSVAPPVAPRRTARRRLNPRVTPPPMEVEHSELHVPPRGVAFADQAPSLDALDDALADKVPEMLTVARGLRPQLAAEIESVGRLFFDGAAEAAVVLAAPPPAKQAASAAAVRSVAPKWCPIRVLHLSDLHFSAKTAWDAGTVLGRLAVDVARLWGEVGGVDLVVVTGDIADFGTAEEYVQAAAWLTGPLAAAAGVAAAQIHVVPGNHDVHRGVITRTARMVADGLLRDPDPQQAISEMMGSEAERAPLLAHQAAYLTFSQTFHPGLTAPWWSERPEVRGLTVHLAGFNSAWLSASDADRGNLLLSRWQCHQLLAGADDADLTIALLHHPWDYLAEHDQQLVEEEIRRRCGVILHGHLHQQKARLASDPDRDVLQLAAGASYAGSKWANAYQLLELDPMCGEARIHFRVWDGFDWIPDRNRYQKAPDGVATLPLRLSPRAPPPVPKPTPTPAEDAKPAASRSRLSTYRAEVRKRVDAMPWLSRQLGLSRSLTEVCVSVEVDEQPEHAPPSHTAHAEHVPLSDVIGTVAARWVMLGDPGSGKSTLLRRLAWDLTQRGDWLPVLLHAGELAAHDDLLGAVKTVWGKSAAEAVADWPEARLLVLVDGLDEVGDPRAVRRAMLARAHDIGEATMIVAGRPEGYPEPWAGFGVLQIQPLADAEQERLLTNLGVSPALLMDQLPRLRHDPRLREIVARPLLLTLAALVLIQDGMLPEKRVQLYQRAVECLLHRGELNQSAPSDVVRAPDDTLAALVAVAPSLLSMGPGPWPRAACVEALRSHADIIKRLAHNWPGDTARLFLEESTRTVGILVPQDRGRKYAFAHRTFGEYLASCALVSDRARQKEVARSWPAAPAQWAEVLALMVAQLPPKRADNIIAQLVKAGDVARPLLLRVLASAEGLRPATVRGVLKLEGGWEEKELRTRQAIIEEIPALVKDLSVAVGLLEQVARSTSCGHDLFWIREVLRRIERGEVEGGVLDGSVEDAKRAAKGAADNVLSHLDSGKRAELLALLKPWWRPIPAGSFNMGRDECGDEKPIHRVTFTSGFQMLGVPVTWAMYRLFDPGHDAARDGFGGTLPPEAQDEVPVYNVSWFASVMFAEWVGARLPLEPEWEYACRAGTTTRFWSGDTDDDLTRVGWIHQNSDVHPHPVKQKPKNAWGLHDVHGNVYEWCADVYDGKAHASRASGLIVDPRGLTFAVGIGAPRSAESVDRGAPRVLRGGSWGDGPGGAPSAERSGEGPSGTATDIGFRLLLSTPERA